MVARKDEVLLQFLDRLYREILAMENARGLQGVESGDLRPPIEHYHDAVRAWAAGRDHETRLSVDALAYDLRSLRARSSQLAEGPQAFFSYDFRQGVALKRQLVMESAKLVLPLESVKEDLTRFAKLVMRNDDGARLQQELDNRAAQKYLRKLIGQGRWEPLDAREFWDGFTYVVNNYRETEGMKLADGVPKLDSLFRGSGKDVSPPKSARPSYYRQAEEGLKALWVQMLHPAILLRSFTPAPAPGIAPQFDAEQYISEEEWQGMAGEAAQLAEAYTRYTLLFAAALVETVNTNYMQLLEGLDQLVEAAAELQHRIAEQGQGQDIRPADLERLIAEIENRELHENVEQFLYKQMQERNRRQSEQVHEHLNHLMRDTDGRIKQLESQHFSFLSTQLALYEESKDLVKKLAAQGLNLAGRFVGQAAAQATERGKGGKGRQ